MSKKPKVKEHSALDAIKLLEEAPASKKKLKVKLGSCYRAKKNSVLYPFERRFLKARAERDRRDVERVVDMAYREHIAACSSTAVCSDERPAPGTEKAVIDGISRVCEVAMEACRRLAKWNVAINIALDLHGGLVSIKIPDGLESDYRVLRDYLVSFYSPAYARGMYRNGCAMSYVVTDNGDEVIVKCISV